MRTIHLGCIGLFVLVGCSTAASQRPHGETLRAYAGGIPLVFTNATPDKMCGLYMSDDGDMDYGDNWLDARGLPSGVSVEMHVKPGTYKARWETCPKKGSLPTFAATLWREMAFEVDHETQLYAYVADSVPPTKRAAVLGRDHVKVMFQGQAVAPIGSQQAPVMIAKKETVAPPPPVPAKARFADVIEKPAKKRSARR
jgi:hypothetical protein